MREDKACACMYLLQNVKSAQMQVYLPQDTGIGSQASQSNTHMIIDSNNLFLERGQLIWGALETIKTPP